MLAVMTYKQMQALGRAEILDDPRFAEWPARVWRTHEILLEAGYQTGEIEILDREGTV